MCGSAEILYEHPLLSQFVTITLSPSLSILHCHGKRIRRLYVMEREKESKVHSKPVKIRSISKPKPFLLKPQEHLGLAPDSGNILN